MTHDELLGKMYRVWSSELSEIEWKSIGKRIDALRAVVELHKPRTTQLTPDFEYTNCVCGNDYPCPTIQAIEKELR